MGNKISGLFYGEDGELDTGGQNNYCPNGSQGYLNQRLEQLTGANPDRKNSGVDIKQVQQQAIGFLKTGKELFDNAVSLEKQKEGYENFLKGIELLVRLKQYTKDNKNMAQAIGQKITELLVDCKYMKDQIMTKDPKVKQIHEKKIQNSIIRPLPQFPSPKPNNQTQNQNKNQNHNQQDTEASKIQDQVTGAILVKRPTITWDSIAGLEIAKSTLREAIYLPLTQPQIFQGVLTPWKGILLYGPPGTGKTMLAEACASMVSANFFNITSSDITSKYVGETEKIVKALFQTAREKAPSIIFVDEVDSIAGKRSEDEHEASRRLKNQFFQEMEGIKGDSGVNVVVIGATNFPWQLDPAMRRRFEKRVYIPLPNQKDIVYMLKRSLDKVGHSVKGSQFTEIAKKLVGYSGSDVASFVKQCCMVPLDKTARATHFKQCNVDGENGWVCCDPNERGAEMVDVSDIGGSNIFPPLVEYQDCIESIANSKPSVGQEDLKKYKSFTKEFGMEG